MGGLSYIGWAVLMASVILFGTILGIALGEWRNTSVRTRASWPPDCSCWRRLRQSRRSAAT